MLRSFENAHARTHAHQAPLHKFLDIGAQGASDHLAEWGMDDSAAENIDALLGLDAFDTDGGAAAHRSQHHKSAASAAAHAAAAAAAANAAASSPASTGAAPVPLHLHTHPQYDAAESDGGSSVSSAGYTQSIVGLPSIKHEEFGRNSADFFVPIKAPLSPPDSTKSSVSGSDRGSDDELQTNSHRHSHGQSPASDSGYPSSSSSSYGSLSSLTSTSPTSLTAAASAAQPSPLSKISGQKRGASNALTDKPTKADPVTKARKKTAHNAIERKYRNSINDSINDLKACLPADMLRNSKTRSKAAILQKCHDYIRHLEKSNTVLRNENRVLKAQLGGSGGLADSGGAASAHTFGGMMGATGEVGKAVLCVMACGVVMVGTNGLAGGGGGVDGGPASARPHHNGGGRVLAAFDDAGADEGSSTGSPPLVTPLQWVVGIMLPWVIRLLVFTVGFILFFMYDRVTDAEGAKAHEEKCAVAVVNNDPSKAKHHALKALALLGQPLPTSRGSTYLGVVLAFFRQLSHRCLVGQVLDNVLTRRTKAAMEATVVVANVNHMLHQILIQEAQSGKGGKDNRYLKSLTMMQSVNAAEAVSECMDPVALIQVYVAAAAQVHLSFQSEIASVLAHKYIGLARTIFHSCAEDVPTLAWLFKPEGDAFFRSRAWCTQVCEGPDGARLQPGSLEQLGLAYRAQLLQTGLRNFFSGEDTQGMVDMFCELRQCAEECGDAKNEWWAAMGVVIVSWRHGKTSNARQVFCEIDQMENRKTKLQQFVYVACRAHQALLDDNHALCWQALGIASTLAGDINVDDSVDGCRTMHQLSCLVGYQALLSTRVALLRLRTYLGQQNGTDRFSAVPAIPAGGGESVTDALILEKLQADVTKIRQFSAECELAKPSAHLYQAIHRSLVGGRVSSTEHIFHQAMKAARRLQMPYDEASAMLQAAIHLRSALTAPAMRAHLTKAAVIFRELNAVDELCTARKILHVVA